MSDLRPGQVAPISWFDVYKHLLVNQSNNRILDRLNKVYSNIKSDFPTKDYVYLVTYEFGSTIVNRGTTKVAESNLVYPDSKYQFIRKNDVLNDLSYSSDPLGVILNNEAVIVQDETIIEKKVEKVKRQVPIGRLSESDFLGVFGTVNYLTNSSKSRLSNQNWSVIAGNPFFQLNFQFNDSSGIHHDMQLEYGNYFYEEEDLIDRNIPFLEKLNCANHTNVIYIPQFVFTGGADFGFSFSSEIFKKDLFSVGWMQSEHLRNKYFDDSSSKKLLEYSLSKVGMKEDKYIALYFHLLRISLGEDDGFLPISNDDAEFSYLRSFIKKNETYFSKTSSYAPVIFKLKRIKSKNDFAVISLIDSPIPYYHFEKSTTDTNKQLITIQSKLSEMQFDDALGNISKLRFTVFGNYSGTDTKYKPKRGSELPTEIKQRLGLNLSKKFELSTDFKRAILIESSLDNIFPKLKVLKLLENKFDLVSNDYQNWYLIGVQHLLSSTGSMIEKLIKCGFMAKNIFLTGKIYSTNNEVESSLKHDLGVKIYPSKLDQKLGFYSNSLKEVIAEMWHDLVSAAELNKRANIIVLDDGGYCLSSVDKKLLDKFKIYGIEQTTSGINKKKQFNEFPVLNVAESAVKINIEPMIVAESVKIRLHNVFQKLNPEKIGIVGYGYIGKTVAHDLAIKGYSINVYDKKKNYIENSSVNYFHALDELYENSDVILGATGEDISKDFDWLEKAKGNKTLLSISSGDIEFQHFLRTYDNQLKISDGSDVSDILKDRHVFNDKEFKIEILRGGMVANFTGAKNSGPANLIQITRGLLLGSIYQILNNKENLRNTILKLDPELQKELLHEWFRDQNEVLEYYPQDLVEKFGDIEWIAENSGGELLKIEKKG